MNFVKEKEDCCGCSACESICPQNCIAMHKDSEGFLYPIVDEEKCVHCGLCEKACPISRAKHDSLPMNHDKQGYVVQNKDLQILKESTSGGFFTAIASYVLAQGGVVFGAKFDSDFVIIHGMTENLTDLKAFRNSKYSQSSINGMYQKCKELLNHGRLVCFSGTPCQIAGLTTFLGKSYENLVTVDVVCHGVPSPLLFEKYLQWRKNAGKIQDVKFRDKTYGYFSSTMSVYYENNTVVRNEVNTDPMLKFFFDDLCSRPSCYHCSFKTIDRVSDFTIFDCWHAVRVSNQFGSRGATAVIARTKRAKDIMQELRASLIVEQTDAEELVRMDGKMMNECVSMNPARNTFFEKLQGEDGFETVLTQYATETIKAKVKRKIKMFFFKTRLFNFFMSVKMKY